MFFGLSDDETTEVAVGSVKALYPLYPQTKGVDSWDLQRAISFARTLLDEVIIHVDRVAKRADHPAIADCCVVGAPDEEWGEEIGAAPFLAIPAANAAERQLARAEEAASLEEIYAEQVRAGEPVG